MSERAQESAVQHSGIVEHHHQWVGSGDPPTVPAGPPAPPTTPGVYGEGGGYNSFPWSWVGGLLALGLVLAALAAIAYGIFSWVDGNGKDKPKPGGGLTIRQILQQDDFRPSRHAICSVTRVADGTAYRLVLNRGTACRRAVEVVLPSEKVLLANDRRARQSNATWVFNPRTYSKGSDALKVIRRLSLGEKLKVNLRTVVVRLKPTDYRRLLRT